MVYCGQFVPLSIFLLITEKPPVQVLPVPAAARSRRWWCPVGSGDGLDVLLALVIEALQGFIRRFVACGGASVLLGRQRRRVIGNGVRLIGGRLHDLGDGLAVDGGQVAG